MATIKNTKGAKCWKCNGSGKFYFGGAIVNGVFTGKTGPCYQCRGTGIETPADARRCAYYWKMNIGRYA